MEKSGKKYPLEFRGSDYLSLVPLAIFAVFCELFFVVFKVYEMDALAIIMFGPVANELGKTKNLHPYRRANLLDGIAYGWGRRFEGPNGEPVRDAREAVAVRAEA